MHLTKPMKTIIFTIMLAATLLGCDSKEKARLGRTVDSLNNVLAESVKRDVAMNEIGIMLDSIDVNRQVLRTRIVEGISYADYIDRLKEINTNIKDLQVKVTSLESNQR